LCTTDGAIYNGISPRIATGVTPDEDTFRTVPRKDITSMRPTFIMPAN
jgi:hypothetical protein